MTIYNDTQVENITTSSPNDFQIILQAIATENINISTSYLVDLYISVIENLKVSEALNSSGIFHKNLVDISKLEDYTKIIYNLLVAETFHTSSYLVNKYLQIAEILDSFSASESPSIQATFKTALALALTLSDITEQAYRAEIQEIATLNDTIIDLFVRSAILIDHITATLVDSNFLILGVVGSDSFKLSDINNVQSLFHSEILEDFEFVGVLRTNEACTGYSFNPEGYALSTYSNYNFNSMANFQSKYLLANSSGLYEMGGTTDDLAEIVVRLKSSTMDFGTSNQKQVKKMYLGLTNDSTLVLKVTVDGNGEYYYELNSSITGLDTQAIKIGKGLVGRYWQFELITKENSSLDLDEVEFLPVEFRRKI